MRSILIIFSLIIASSAQYFYPPYAPYGDFGGFPPHYGGYGYGDVYGYSPYGYPGGYGYGHGYGYPYGIYGSKTLTGKPK